MPNTSRFRPTFVAPLRLHSLLDTDTRMMVKTTEGGEMIRKAFYCSLWLSAFVLLSGCGHDGLIEGDLSTGGSEKSTITGGVLAPGRTLAANTSFLDRFAGLFFPSAFALSGNVQPIGLGELVSLDRVSASDAADGHHLIVSSVRLAARIVSTV